jgi:2-hydroxy-3-keto-5-methylthiopentenyl-1-phosphate phosphatase
MLVFYDFDGTITNYDTLDYIIQLHYGKEQQKLWEQDLINGANHNTQLQSILKDTQYSIGDILHKLKKI